MPCRSASASLASATSKESFRRSSDAIAYGEEGSIRILPSQSTVMNPNRGSTVVLTTSRSSLKRSAMACQ